MTVSFGKKIGIASLIMMLSVFASRLIGLVREMVIADFGGATTMVDAYQAAFLVPEILNHLVASGFLSVTFIPIFTRYLARDREEEGWHTFSLILTVFGAALLILMAAAFVLAPYLIDSLAAGRDDPVFTALAVRMTRIIIPAQFFFFSGGLFMAVQFAHGKFSFPALAPLIYNIGIILGGVLLGNRVGVEGFSWGVLAGAFVGNFLLQFWAARRVGLQYRPVFDLSHPDLRKYVRLTLHPAVDGRADHDVFHRDIYPVLWLFSAGGRHCRAELRTDGPADSGGSLRPGGGRGIVSLHGPVGG